MANAQEINYDRDRVLTQEDVNKIVECFKQNPDTFNKWDVIHSALNLSPEQAQLWRTQLFVEFNNSHALYTKLVQAWISETDSEKRTLGILLDILDQNGLKLTADYMREAYSNPLT